MYPIDLLKVRIGLCIPILTLLTLLQDKNASGQPNPSRRIHRCLQRHRHHIKSRGNQVIMAWSFECDSGSGCASQRQSAKRFPTDRD